MRVLATMPGKFGDICGRIPQCLRVDAVQAVVVGLAETDLLPSYRSTAARNVPGDNLSNGRRGSVQPAESLLFAVVAKRGGQPIVRVAADI